MTAMPAPVHLQVETPFYAVAQSTPDAIISANNRGIIIFWNNAAESIFGYTPDEVLGQPITILMSEKYRERHSQGMRRYQETGEKRAIGNIVELEGLRKNGEEFPIELSLSEWHADGVQYFNGIIRDITARKEAERMQQEYAKILEERNQELYAYDRTIAHDLKNPIHLVHSYADLILMQFRDDLPNQVRERLERIIYASKSMVEMVDQLLTMATLRDSASAVEAIDTHAVVTLILDHLGQFIERENVDVKVIGTLPPVIGHDIWLKQIFANLITNAIKYKGKENSNPWIKIRGMRVGKMVRFEVEDNGLGIPESAQRKLFEAFERTHQKEAEGYGVGLSIVQRIVQRLNGQIGVESQAGQGSTFWFLLPAADEPN